MSSSQSSGRLLGDGKAIGLAGRRGKASTRRTSPSQPGGGADEAGRAAARVAGGAAGSHAARGLAASAVSTLFSQLGNGPACGRCGANSTTVLA
jgi:hypothetical protein